MIILISIKRVGLAGMMLHEIPVFPFACIRMFAGHFGGRIGLYFGAYVPIFAVLHHNCVDPDYCIALSISLNKLVLETNSWVRYTCTALAAFLLLTYVSSKITFVSQESVGLFFLFCIRTVSKSEMVLIGVSVTTRCVAPFSSFCRFNRLCLHWGIKSFVWSNNIYFSLSVHAFDCLLLNRSREYAVLLRASMHDQWMGRSLVTLLFWTRRRHGNSGRE